MNASSPRRIGSVPDLIPGESYASAPVHHLPKDNDRHAAHFCQKHLKPKDPGPKCRTSVLLNLLFNAARICSIVAGCKTLQDAPSDQAVYHALAATLQDAGPALALLVVAVALILRNVWVWVHQEVLAERIRGGRKIDLKQLPFRALLLGLQHLVEGLLGVSDSIPTE